ncbi:hypothetical protein PVAP13_7NG310124 [Panicum virgatum]|uniref:Uncharacterized protein n=1 Tax=Panicum virgatum TaxID=38727 RepID=A0A8T0QDM3_PANVG|nr:hypothetical protein PVAP13_7NG310124 [Panicum virgatum]
MAAELARPPARWCGVGSLATAQLVCPRHQGRRDEGRPAGKMAGGCGGRGSGSAEEGALREGSSAAGHRGRELAGLRERLGPAVRRVAPPVRRSPRRLRHRSRGPPPPPLAVAVPCALAGPHACSAARVTHRRAQPRAQLEGPRRGAVVRGHRLRGPPPPLSRDAWGQRREKREGLCPPNINNHFSPPRMDRVTGLEFLFPKSSRPGHRAPLSLAGTPHRMSASQRCSTVGFVKRELLPR